MGSIYAAHVLFSERKRELETAEREAAGENLWREQMVRGVRVRLVELSRFFSEQIATKAHRSLGQDAARLLRVRLGHEVSDDFERLLPETDNVTVLNWLGAAHFVINKELDETRADHFAKLVNHVLREERIAYKFVDGSIVEFSSDELNVEVVEPAVRLLVGVKFNAAHGAYMDALREITRGNAGDAITDAATALQETLVALGCSGNALGPLLKDAKKLGLLGSHDQALIDGIAKFIDWVSADRSTTGDAHKHSQAAVADAWLVVHVVGALIVRLADETTRGSAKL